MTGSIWPGVMLHAVWDAMVGMISTLTAAVPPALNIEPDSVDAAAALSAAGADTGGGAKSPPSCSMDTSPCAVSSSCWPGCCCANAKAKADNLAPERPGPKSSRCWSVLLSKHDSNWHQQALAHRLGRCVVIASLAAQPGHVGHPDGPVAVHLDDLFRL